MRSVIVIGAGVGGLAVAIRLARRGVSVTLLEKNSSVGGKLNFWSLPHPHRSDKECFHFDTGPSLLTLPFIIDDLFTAAGEDVRDYLTLARLDPIARFGWGDGTSFDLRADEKDCENEIRKFATKDLRGWQAICKKGRLIWDLSEPFLFKSPEQTIHRRFSILNALKRLTVPLRIGMFSTYSSLIDRHIRNPKLRDVFYHYATYAGASPFQAPATLAVIPFTEMYFGGFHIVGGMYQLAAKLEQIARKLGVEIRTDTSVKTILIKPAASRDATRRASAYGVQLDDGTILESDAVIANCDVVYTYRNLIEEQYRPHYTDSALNQIDPGSSAMILLLGIEGTYPQLAHHNKFMPTNYSDELRSIFETRTIPKEPSIYVCAPTRSDPSLAPHGCENLFVLASAPSLNGKIDWKVETRRYRDYLIKTLEEKHGLADLSKRIVVERMMTPEDLQNTYNTNAGSIHGISSNGRSQAFKRPPNRDRDIAGLYFAGSATHPGGGLPLVALSGKIVSELVLEDFEKTQS